MQLIKHITAPDVISTPNVHDRNKKIYWHLIGQSELKMSEEQLGLLYDHCVNLENLHEFAPIAKWGIIPEEKDIFPAICKGFTIDGKTPSQSVTKFKNPDHKTGRVKAISTDQTQWSGIGFTAPGQYVMRAHTNRWG